MEITRKYTWAFKGDERRSWTRCSAMGGRGTTRDAVACTARLLTAGVDVPVGSVGDA